MAKGLERITCTECDRPHKLQRKDLDDHLRSIQGKGDRNPRQLSPSSSVPANRGTRIATEQETRVRNMRRAWNHVPADHMPEEIRQALGL
ncbi:MAG: hypothetical protein NTZ25_01255 [Candidatus Peregrinibacteria bacterium]|nr:hypothetical protein [Candidatus Peregrinibacteria bacterium]